MYDLVLNLIEIHMNSAKHIGAHLQAASSGIGDITAKKEQLNLLNQLWQESAPPDIRSHTRVINYTASQIIIGTDSPVWGSRIRYQSSQLLKGLRCQGLPTLRSIKIRVIPPQDREVKVKRTIEPLSAETASTLEEVAKTIKYKPLARALLRLGRHRE